MGGIGFQIYSPRELFLEPELLPFIKNDLLEQNIDVDIEISWDWEALSLPAVPKLGQDLLQDYFQEGSRWWCATRGGWKGYVACASYEGDFAKIKCTINEKPFIKTAGTLGVILRYLPMRAVLQHFGVLLLHAAQVMAGGKGILFSGPSGAGKTTQSKLWEQAGAGIRVCNDRTLVRKQYNKWQGSGYVLDGSEPVSDGKQYELGCIVFPLKAECNQIEKMSPARATAALIGQTVIDNWNSRARTSALEYLLQLTSEIPVFQFFCTPDLKAADCLKQQLRKEGIIQ